LATAQEPFDALLAWLDSERETAGHKYEVIRSGLIRIFISQGFNDAEDLADLTINRVASKLPEIRADYVGEPARYFHGVARNIILEARRRKEIATDSIPERLSQAPNTTDRYDCLLKCLELLSSEKRELILDYYLYEGRDKIEHHICMAKELGITEGALRTRAHHIRVSLEKCVLQCTQELMEKQKDTWKSLLKKKLVVGDIQQERQS
jgi:DNA-directed RNA polymerase specialized sigma24 family protein